MDLGTEKIRKLMTKFHEMDRNNDGELDRKEIYNCVVNSGLPESEVEHFMELFDLNADGKVTLQEYSMALGLKPFPRTDVEEWKIAFESIDTNCSNYLDPVEIRYLVHRFGYSQCTQQEIDQWIANVDTDRDGQISFPEFCALMETLVTTNT